MAQATRFPIAARISGRFAGLDWYTSRRGKHIAYAPPPITQPPTPEQIECRDRFRKAMKAYKALTQGERQSLEIAARRASLSLSGLNVWISAYTCKGQTALDALSQQTGIALPSLPENR